MPRLRLRVPAAPQLVEHSDQGLHVDVMQSTGHALVLQIPASTMAPHGVPLPTASVTVVRWRWRVPEPQETEHVDQLSHALCTQSTSHSSELQG